MAEPLLTGPTEGEGPTNIETLPLRLEEWWDEPEPPPAAGEPVLSDLDALQGVWASVSGKRRTVLLVSGDRFTVYFLNGDLYMGALEIDPVARPKTMDMRIEEGPPQHKGLTTLCVYELKGDLLRWCTAGPGQKERLSAFPTEEGAKHLGMIFRRESPF